MARVDRLTDKGYRLGELDRTFGFLLHAAWRDAQKTFQEYFAGLDMTPSGYSVLLLIENNPGCAPGDLSEIMGITSNNMTRLIDDLVAKGMVERKVDQQDRRARLLYMTAEGQSFLHLLSDRHAAFEAHFNERIGASEIQGLCDILRRFD